VNQFPPSSKTCFKSNISPTPRYLGVESFIVVFSCCHLEPEIFQKCICIKTLALSGTLPVFLTTEGTVRFVCSSDDFISAANGIFPYGTPTVIVASLVVPIVLIYVKEPSPAPL